MDLPLRERITTIPQIYDHAAGTRLLEKLRLDGVMLGDIETDLVFSVGSCSPYLSKLMQRSPANLVGLLGLGPEKNIEKACTLVWAACEIENIADQVRELRQAKDLAALTIAMSEICGAWSTMQAAEQLSIFADAAVGAATRMALKQLFARGFIPADEHKPEELSGISVIAMGKHGACELNYSSDIDLVFLYDRDAVPLAEDPRRISSEIVKLVCSRLSDQTKDGYVFRTDIRLRPDPSSSAAAVSMDAAEAYYESYGQNWERAAYIKARPVGGDIELGKRFLLMMRPFIWRKYLDYAAIEDIHSIVRQLHSAEQIRIEGIPGHNLKTGWGGIREVEFFVQTQQLVLGGKNIDLRQSGTMSAIDALAAKSVINKNAQMQLQASYEKLRKYEHRIQMIADEQTHKIPLGREALERVAAFSGFQSEEFFVADIFSTLKSVNDNFKTLFEKDTSLANGYGALSFTGVDIDNRTIDSLFSMGFERPRDIATTISRWHTGDLRATRTKRGRELLTEITPKILSALTKSERPDEAFIAFDRFLRHLPAGVQIFSLLSNNPMIFENLIKIMTISPDMGKLLAKNTHLIEVLIEGDWSMRDPQPDIDNLVADLKELKTFEAKVNFIRRWGAEQKFNTTALILLGFIDVETAAENYTIIADTAIELMLPLARSETERLYGEIDGHCVVIGLGRLGIRRMTSGSDVDLMFVHDAPIGATSNGPQKLSATEFFLRMVRRFIASLTAPGTEPALFEVDMALRPSGGAGPAAVSLSAFEAYYRDSAWIWEIMAMTKARIVAGNNSLADKIFKKIRLILTTKRDSDRLQKDVISMRKRIKLAKKVKDQLDVRNMDGGIIDIDFVTQYLLLCVLPYEKKTFSGPPFSNEVLPQILSADVNSQNNAAVLLKADKQYDLFIQITRAAGLYEYDPHNVGEMLNERLAESFGCNDLSELESYFADLQSVVLQIASGILDRKVCLE